METAKNLVLSGPRSVTLFDPTPASLPDLGLNFFLTAKGSFSNFFFVFFCFCFYLFCFVCLLIFLKIKIFKILNFILLFVFWGCSKRYVQLDCVEGRARDVAVVKKLQELNPRTQVRTLFSGQGAKQKSEKRQ